MADMSNAPEGATDVPEIDIGGFTQTDFAEVMTEGMVNYTDTTFIEQILNEPQDAEAVAPTENTDTPEQTQPEPTVEQVTSSELEAEKSVESTPIEPEDTVNQPVDEEVVDQEVEQLTPQEPTETLDPLAELEAMEPMQVKYATQEEGMAHSEEFQADSKLLLQGMKKIFPNDFGYPDEGASDVEIAEWAIARMGMFNWNLTTMAADAFSLDDLSAEEIEGFVKVMDAYETLPNFTLSGSGRAAAGILTDPTTYLGVGLLARLFGQGGKFTAKQMAKKLVEKGVSRRTALRIVNGGKVLATAAVEGAIYGGSDDLLRQSVEITAGRQDAIDYGRTAIASGYGALAGPGIVITGYSGYKATKVMMDGLLSNAKNKKVVDEITGEAVDAAPTEKPKTETEVPAEGQAKPETETNPVDQVNTENLADDLVDDVQNVEIPAGKRDELDPQEALDVERKFDDQLDEVNKATESDVVTGATKPNKDGNVVRDNGDGTITVEGGHKWIPNLTRIETTEQALKLIFETAQKRVGKLLKTDGRKNGTQTLNQAKKEAKQAAVELAEQSGRDTGAAGKLFDKLIEAAGVDQKALKEIQARSIVVGEMITEIATELTKMAKSKPASEFTNAEKAQFMQLKEVLDSLSVMDGLYSRNFSRNLGSRRITRGTQDILNILNKGDEAQASGVTGLVNRVRREVQSVNDEFAALHSAVKSSKGDLKILRKNTTPSKLSKVIQKAVGIRTEAMISGLSTQMAAFFGNLINIVKYPVVKATASVFRGGEAGRRMRREAVFILGGYRMYAAEASKLAIRAFKQGGGITDPSKSQSKIDGYTTHESDPNVIKKLLKFQFFGDMMSGFDEFTKALFTRSEAYAKAYAKITEQNPKISKKEAKKKAEEYVENLIDKETGQFKDPDLIQTSRELSYMQDVNDTAIGRAVNTVANVGGGVMRGLVIPFVKAPLNIVSEGLMFIPGTRILSERQFRITNNFKQSRELLQKLEDTPNAFSKEEADAIRRTYEQTYEEFAFLKAKKAIGTGVGLASVQMTLMGNMTGAGPGDKDERREWLKTHQPYSIKVGDKWISYKWMEPFATPMGFFSDLTMTTVRLGKQEDVGIDEVFGAATMLFADTIINKSMLVGAQQFLEAITDENRADTFWRSFAASWVPSVLKDFSPNDMSKEGNTVANALAKKIPMLDAMVGNRYDDFGRPIENTTWYLGLPAAKAKEEGDPVALALYELKSKFDRNGSLGSMPTNLGLPTKGLDFRKVINKGEKGIGLGQSVYSQFHKILGRTEIDGKTMYEAIREEMNTDLFRALSDPRTGNDSYASPSIKRIGDIMSMYRQAALRELYEVSPEYAKAKDKAHNEKMQALEFTGDFLQQLGIN